MNRYNSLLFILFLVAGTHSCDLPESDEGPDATARSAEKTSGPAQRIVDDAILAHGADKVSGSRIEFDFRDRHYVSERKGGLFRYERIFTDSSGSRVYDVLSNDGFRREVDGERVEVTEERSKAYSNSVNSVLYFALLPYYLNDPAVQKAYLGESRIKGEPYHKVKITFRQEGGGKDFEDVFIYWFHRDRKTMDFFAYNYQTDGGGARFREAYNIREVNGIRFADFINYKPRTETMAVESFDRLYETGGMEELSRIETKDPGVVPLTG